MREPSVRVFHEALGSACQTNDTASLVDGIYGTLSREQCGLDVSDHQGEGVQHVEL